MRPFDELLERRDQIVRADRVARRRIGPRAKADVVDPLHNHEPLHARLHQHVAIEASQRADARAVAQYPIAGDALIQYGDVRATRGRQTAGQKAGPATIGIGRRHRAIGDGISKSDDRRRIRRRGHIDIGQPIIRLRGGGVRDRQSARLRCLL